MRFRQFVLLLTLLFVLLTGCDAPNAPAKNERNEVTIHAVEFYSRTPVSAVDIRVVEQATKKEVGHQSVATDGTATFQQLQPDTAYDVAILRRLHGVTETQSTHTFTFDPNVQHIFFETFFVSHDVGLAIPLVKQLPALPNGCEITSVAAILQYYGEHIDHVTLAANYLAQQPMKEVGHVRYGPDPNVSFAGNPAQANGFYVYAAPVVDAANRYLTEANSPYRAYDETGATIDELRAYLQKGIPVAAWITIDLQPARTNGTWTIEGTSTVHPIYSNLHAVAVMDITDDEVQLMNPLTGYETISLAAFKAAYEALNQRAIVVY